MQIVIDIPDRIQYGIENGITVNGSEASQIVLDAVKSGTPLPKGHGRLIDADALEARDISPEAWYSPMWGFEWVDIEDAPTIIEADREVDDADSN